MLQLIVFMLIIVLLKKITSKTKHRKSGNKKKLLYVQYVLQIFLTKVRRAQIHLRLV